MANFDVTKSALTQAATNIRKYNTEFREQAKATYEAAQALSEGWEGESYEEFVNNMQQLNNWMNQMAETVDTYAVALEKARDTYEGADMTSAGYFKK